MTKLAISFNCARLVQALPCNNEGSELRWLFRCKLQTLRNSEVEEVAAAVSSDQSRFQAALRTESLAAGVDAGLRHKHRRLTNGVCVCMYVCMYVCM